MPRHTSGKLVTRLFLALFLCPLALLADLDFAFPATSIGQTRSNPQHVLNTLIVTDPIVVNSMTVSGNSQPYMILLKEGAGTEVNAVTLPFTLEAGRQFFYEIFYTPTTAGTHAASYTFFYTTTRGDRTVTHNWTGTGESCSAVVSVDIRESLNEQNHVTDMYQQNYVLRRGSNFIVSMEVAGAAETAVASFEAEHSFDGGITTIPIPLLENGIPPGSWGTQFLSAVTSEGTTHVTQRIAIPGDVPVGRYSFTALDSQCGGEIAFPQEIVVLFNPWSEADTGVYLAQESKRAAYVLDEIGLMWRGKLARKALLPWSYDQFDEQGINLAVALEGLEGEDSFTRANPLLLARHLSSFANVANDPDGNRIDGDRGILWGRWAGPDSENYPGGTFPLEWKNSLSVLSDYLADPSANGVKWGQCWVFAGIVNTMLRTLGIPGRPVTNYESGWDKDGDGIISTVDSIWNFHIWNEAWMNGEWQVIDATAMNQSDGVFRLGPARVRAVKDKVGGLYDVEFVTAEVDGIERTIEANGEIVDNRYKIGHDITTKVEGSQSAPRDITSAYKIPETTIPTKQSGVLLAGGIRVITNIEDNPKFGKPMLWELTLANEAAQPRTLYFSISGVAAGYRGDIRGHLDEKIAQTLFLLPGETRIFTVNVPFSSLMPFAEGMFRVKTFVKVDGWSDPQYGLAETVLVDVDFGEMGLSISPPLENVFAGQEFEATASYTNPLSVPLTECSLLLHGVGLTVVGVPLNRLYESEDRITIGTIAPGEELKVTRTIKWRKNQVHGHVDVRASLRCNEIGWIEGRIDLEVSEAEIFKDGFESGNTSAWGM